MFRSRSKGLIWFTRQKQREIKGDKEVGEVGEVGAGRVGHVGYVLFDRWSGALHSRGGYIVECSQASVFFKVV